MNICKSSSKTFFTVFVLSILIIAMPQLSFASDANNNDIVRILCNVIDYITGGIGKGIAVIILISLAISLFLGKVSWGLAIAVASGMGLLFGSTSLINAVTAGVGNNAAGANAAMCARQENNQQPAHQ